MLSLSPFMGSVALKVLAGDLTAPAPGEEAFITLEGLQAGLDEEELTIGPLFGLGFSADLPISSSKGLGPSADRFGA